MAAASYRRQSDPLDEAIEALQNLSEMCENLLVEDMPPFEQKFVNTRAALDRYRKELAPHDQTIRALTVAMTRFTTRAQSLIAYFHRHDESSRVSSADGEDFLEGFRNFQLATLEEIGRLQDFLLTMHTLPQEPFQRP